MQYNYVDPFKKKECTAKNPFITKECECRQCEAERDKNPFRTVLGDKR